MMAYGGLLLIAALVLAGCAAAGTGTSSAAAPAGIAPDEQVRNLAFRAGQGDQAAEWTAWSPVWQNAACTIRRTAAGLLVEAPHEPFAVGGVRQTLAGLQPGQAYAIEAQADLRAIAAPQRAVLVRWHWLKQGQPLHPAGILVHGPMVEGSRATFRDVLVMPADADGAQVALEVKWPEGGQVIWQRVSVRPTATPAPRRVKIGTVYLRPKNSTPEQNLDLWCAKVDEAGRLGLNIVCLSEAITQIGTDKTVADLAEPIPGPSTQRLAAAAKRNHLWVVAGLFERDGSRVYNTAVLLNPQGELAGKYRKIHLPREEWNKGVTPGHEYPVFQTEFGTIAIQICYDWFFPEPEALFAMRGAEIVFAPTWGDTMADEDGKAQGETVFRVRARDNGIYLVPSVYDGNSMVIDPMGRILASSRGREGVFWCEVDLAARERLPWVGHWRSIGPRDRMPETYGPLAEPK